MNEQKHVNAIFVTTYECSIKNNMHQHIASVFEIIKSFKCDICDYRCSRKDHLKKHFSFMKEISNSTCNAYKYMKERNHLIVTFVTTYIQLLNVNILSAVSIL